MKYIVICCILAFFISCKKVKIKKQIAALYNKEIWLPTNSVFKSQGQDTIVDYLYNSSAKIVVYIDSIGCEYCKLNLSEWSVKIRESQRWSNDVRVLFIVNSNDYAEFEQFLQADHFTYPIFYDSNGDFEKHNKLPEDSRFHTFLINSKNQIILVGSPLGNQKMWLLYREEIKRNDSCL